MHAPMFPAAAIVIAASYALAVEPALSQTEKRLSAREIFYAAQAEPPAVKKAAPQRAAPARKKAVESARAKLPAQAPATAQVPEPAPAPVASPVQLAEGAEVVPAAYTATESTPLGIRYTILRREGADSVEVAPDAVFRSGDRIRLRLEVNASGYLYIVHRGSSGIWKPLFPTSETAGGDNRVERGRTYDIPAGYVFTFDEQPGEEKLFIVFTRKPEQDLEKLIYSLSGNGQPAAPARQEEKRVLLAMNMVNIDNGLVERMRNVYARDLIIEKVDENSPPAAAAPAMEKAVYVVNPSRGGDSRVVADVTLTHK